MQAVLPPLGGEFCMKSHPKCSKFSPEAAETLEGSVRDAVAVVES